MNSDHWKFASPFAGCKREYKVTESVIEQVQLAAGCSALLPQRQLDAVAGLRAQRRVADFERQTADMRPVVVKLLESGRAVGVGVVDD